MSWLFLLELVIFTMKFNKCYLSDNPPILFDARLSMILFLFKGLKANVLLQFEENARQALQDQNQDSSDRHRSGSYSEAALRR